MSQSDLYKYQSNIDYLGDFPGADVEKNRVLTTLKESSAKLDIESRVGRTLGTVGVNDTSDTQIDPATEGTLSTVADLADALASNGGDTLRTDATLDAETVAIEGDDDDGNTIEANIETLSQAVTDPDGLVTYLARALASQGQDQLQTNIETNNAGLATETTLSSVDAGVGNLEGSLQANATDQLRVDIENEAVDMASETTLSSLDTHLDSLDNALQSQATDQLRVDLQTNNAGTLAVEQQSPVKLEADDDDGNTLQVGAETLSQGTLDPDGLVTYLARALQTQGHDQLRVDLQNNNAGTLPVEQQTPVGVEDSAGTQIDPAKQGTLSSATTHLGNLSDALQSQATDVMRVEQQSPVGVEDTDGNQVDPSLKTYYLDHQTSGHDLAVGDLVIGPNGVRRGTAVTIAATSTDNNAFSVSVEWVDSAGNTYQSESATDIGLDSITEDYARLVRKAPEIEITVTDESGAAQNLVNVHADTER
jgi:hypothetical protein